jgi:flagellar basal body P-ring formation protein FlgA
MGPFGQLAALIAVLLLPDLAAAQAVIATRTLRAGQPIVEADLAIGAQPLAPGLIADPAEALGMEARVTLYGGRPVPLAALQPAALIERNQLVTLVYRTGVLEIRAEGRALARGAAEAQVRVMNLASRTTVTGRVAGPGLVSVP